MEWSGCFRYNEIGPQYSKTNRDNPSCCCSYHLSFLQIFDSFYVSIFYFKFYSFPTLQSLHFIKFYINSFLLNQADYMISVLDIPKGNFSFFSNKVLTDTTDVAVYFKLASSQQLKTKDICCSAGVEITIEILTSSSLSDPSL